MICVRSMFSITGLIPFIFSAAVNADTEKTISTETKPGNSTLGSPHNQFDFLIGEWDVNARTYQFDQVVAQTKAVWTARYHDDKRLIIDEWRSIPKAGEDSQFWMTLRTYSDALQRWQIVGLQANQPTLAPTFLGEWRDNEMHMTAEVLVEQGPLQAKVRFYAITDNRFQWEMKMSIDGETWYTYQSAEALRKT